MTIKKILSLCGAMCALSSPLFAQSTSVLMNTGDRLRIEQVTMNGKEIEGILPIANNSKVKIDYSKVNAIDFENEEEPELAEDIELYRISLFDNGLLKGELITLNAEFIKINALGIGEMVIPLSGVQSIVREGAAVGLTAVPKGEAQIIFDSENALQGKLTIHSAKKLSLVDDDLKAEFSMKNVLSIQYAEKPIVSESVKFVLYMHYGCRCYASNISMTGDEIEMTFSDGKKMKLSKNGVKKVFLTTGSQLANKKVLVLAGLASPSGRELTNTVAALDSQLKGWEVESYSDFWFDDKFTEKVMSSRTVVIPEIYTSLANQYTNWKKLQKAPEGEEEHKFPELNELMIKHLRPKLEAFLARGGNVVYLGLNGNVVENNIRLFPVTRTNSSSSEECFFTRRAFSISKGIGDSYRVPYSTSIYSSTTQDMVFARGRYGVTLFGRRVKQGWVIVNGYDMYQPSEVMSKLLVNCVTLKP